MTPEPPRAAEPANPSHAGNGFINRRLRLAGLFIVGGLLIQGISLFWSHPLSFLVFIGVGSLAVLIGIVIYLVALVSPRQS